MPSETNSKNAATTAKTAAFSPIPHVLIDQFVRGAMAGEGANTTTMVFTVALIERVGAPNADKPAMTPDQRNGTSRQCGAARRTIRRRR